jgi:hypothetical protein
VAVAIVFAFAGGEKAFAQSQGQFGIYSLPVIVGDTVVGTTLSPSEGLWRSPNPGSTLVRWEWWRCPNASGKGCRIASFDSTYKLSEADRGSYIALARFIFLLAWPPLSALKPSAAKGPVTLAAVATPVPPPVATPAPPPPPPPPAPAPTFETAAPAPTPVPTSGQVLHQNASQRMLKPFPVVRMRGVLTARGARVTVLSVRAPRKARVVLRCSGSCPTKRWAPTVRHRMTTRVRAFERYLSSGTRISVTVTRKGYIGKRTVFKIRRGRAPLRTDSCVSSAGRRLKCPAG